MRQNFETKYDWLRVCQQLIDDCERDPPRASTICCVAWRNETRPIYEHADFDVADKGCPWRDLIFALRTFPNPLWGWMAVTMWCGPLTPQKLFYILMSCGCDRSEVLNAKNEFGFTALMVASMNYDVFRLLLTQTHLNPATTFAQLPDEEIPRDAFQFLLNASDYNWSKGRKDTIALQLVAYMSVLKCHLPLINYLLLAVYSELPCTATCLWTIITQIIASDLPEAKATKSSLLQRLTYSDGIQGSLLAVAARQQNDDIWEMFASHTLTPYLLCSDAHAESEYADLRYELSALQMALQSGRDKRAAWLASQSPSSHLNQYDEFGYTPLMTCLERGYHQTLKVLLQRITEIDVLVPALRLFSSLDKRTLLPRNFLRSREIVIDSAILPTTLHGLSPLHDIEKQLLQYLTLQESRIPQRDQYLSEFVLIAVPRDLQRIIFSYERDLKYYPFTLKEVRSNGQPVMRQRKRRR
jgi:ankyrin repeat protein